MKAYRNCKTTRRDYFAKFIGKEFLRQSKKKINKQFLNIHENYIYFQERNIFQEKDSNSFNDYVNYLKGLQTKNEKPKYSFTHKTIKSQFHEKKITENEKLRNLLEKQHKNIPSSLFDFIHPYEYFFTQKYLQLNRSKSDKRNKILSLSNKNDSENVFLTTSTTDKNISINNKSINNINKNKLFPSKLVNKKNEKIIISNKNINKYSNSITEDSITNKSKSNLITQKSLNKENNDKNLNNINLNNINLCNTTIKRPETKILNCAHKKLNKKIFLNIINSNTNSNSDLKQTSNNDNIKLTDNSKSLNKKKKKIVKLTTNINNSDNQNKVKSVSKNDVKKDIIYRNVLSAHFSKRKNDKNKQQLYTEILNINSKLDEIKDYIIDSVPDNTIPFKEDNANQLIMRIISEKERYSCRSSRELFDHLKQKHHIKNLTNQYIIQKNNLNGAMKQKFFKYLQRVDEREKRENNIKNMVYRHNFELRKEVNKLTEKDFEKTLNSFNKNNKKIEGLIVKNINSLIKTINK